MLIKAKTLQELNREFCMLYTELGQFRSSLSKQMVNQMEKNLNNSYSLACKYLMYNDKFTVRCLIAKQKKVRAKMRLKYFGPGLIARIKIFFAAKKQLKLAQKQVQEHSLNSNEELSSINGRDK